jgi:hypothetical protein
MAEEILVYKSVIDNTASIKSVQELREANALLKKDLEEAGKVGSEGWTRINKTAQETGKTFQEVQESLKKQFTENKNKVDDFNRSLRQTSQGSGSINELRQTVIALARQYDALSKAERDAAAGSQLRDKLASTTQQLKDLEGETGRFQRNVGNYKQGFIDAAREVEIFGFKVSGVIDPLKKIQSGLQDSGGGIAGFASSIALGAIPIIISGINALVKVYQTYEPVAEAVDRATAGLAASFSALIRGNNILEAARQTSELTGKLQDLEDQKSLFDLNAAKGRKEVIQLLLKSKDASLSLGAQLTAVREANKIEKEESKQQIAFLREQADTEEEIFAVKVGIREKYTKEYGDQLIRQLIDTDDFRNKNIQSQLGITNDELAVLRKRRQDIIDAEGESQNLQDRLRNRQSAIIDKINAEREKELAAEQKAADKRDAQRQKEKEAENRLLEQQAKSEMEIFSKRMSNAKALDDLRKKAESDKLADEAKAFTDQSNFLAKQLQLDLQAAELEKGTAAEKERRKQEIQLISLEKQLDLTRQFVGADGIITKEELEGIYAVELAIRKIREQIAQPITTTLGDAIGIGAKEQSKIQTGLTNISQMVAGVSQVVNLAYQSRINEIESAKDAEIQAIEDSTLSQEQKSKKIRAINKKFAQEQHEIAVKQFRVNQAMQIVNTVIATASAVVAQLANPTPYVGIALAALAAATGVAQIAVIASAKPPAAPKFARGGMLQGPSHQAGGIKAGGVEFEGDELVATKGAGRNTKSRSVMSHINKMFGGVSYPGVIALPNNLQHAINSYIGNAGGSAIYTNFNKFAAGGFVPAFPRTTTDQISGDGGLLVEFRRMSELLMNQPSPVVSVVDINRGQKGVQVIENNGTNG